MRNPVSLALLGAVRAYQWFIAPLLGPRCRYLPSCSEYAIDAVKMHGAMRGSWLAAKRIGRCHPWGGHGHDPVPTPRTHDARERAT
jgi:putative membrane protein insertion efficiency factor